MQLKKLLKWIVLPAILFFMGINLNAQTLYDLEITQVQGTWQPIPENSWSSGDDTSKELEIPFLFPWDGKYFDRLWTNTNGYLALGRIEYTITMSPTASNGYDIIAPFNEDLYTEGSLDWELSGLAPNRILTIQWADVRFFGSSDQHLYFQVKLHESGMVEIIYGPGFTDSPTTEWGGNSTRAFVSGSNSVSPVRYWNIRPNYPNPGESYYYQGNNSEYWFNYEMRDMLQPGFTYIIGEQKPQIVSAVPASGVNLIRNYVYGNGTVDILGQGNEQKPAVELENVASSDIHFTIAGPLTFPVHPEYHIIYDATQTFASNGSHHMTNATTPLENPGDNKGFGAAGNLDLASFYDDIFGGVYEVNVDLRDGDVTDNYSHTINIAYARNLEITKPIDPKSKDEKKYPMTSRIPVKVKYTNRGLTDIDYFYSLARIYDENGVLVWHDSITYEPETGQELTTGNSVDLEFKSFRPDGNGEYRFECEIVYVGDEESMDDTYPWRGDADLIFYVAPEIEAEAISILQPKNIGTNGQDVEIYVGRPIEPVGKFKNNGITDISDAPVEMVITRLSDDEIVYSDNEILPDIPQGIVYNTSSQKFDEFVPPTEGDYQVCIEITATDDDIPTNNSICDTFTVVNALNGIYTIGPDRNTGNEASDNAYNERNFTSLQAAVDELFLRGVTGPVYFEFTTNEYHIGNEYAEFQPALDLRSHVVGMSDINSVTFRPSNDMSLQKGEVDIHLHTGSGIGILFGQSISTYTGNAVVNNVKEARKETYANQVGQFIFDGGSQKALEFKLHTGSHVNMNAVIYLSQGASNVIIRNTIIKNSVAGDKWDYCTLPLARFNDPQFLFEPDSKGSAQEETYSAGIVLRSVPPINKMDFFGQSSTAYINSYGLDTLVNMNNVIDGNEISGFAYGIVSLGMGPLGRNGIATGYYNENNTFINNYIHDVSRAGIFLGHEKNTNVTKNKISAVANATTSFNAGYDVAGIILGGEKRSTYNSYNNINVVVDGNEIHNVGQAMDEANQNVYGIKVEQARNTYLYKDFPDVDDDIIVMNNAIWGIRNGAADVNRFGIRLFSLRNNAAGTAEQIMKTPLAGTYFTKGMKVVNNTVIMEADAYNTTGMLIGVAAQQTDELLFSNNAIAMLDDNSPASVNYYAAVLYQGLLPSEDMGINSDRNVFWLKADGNPDDSAAVFRFIYTDAGSNEIFAGQRDEFLTMNQWQMFTMTEDFESVIGDFTADLTTPSVDDPIASLRIENDPTWPEGSYLNNRGENFDYVVNDIDGNSRGASGQRYDIGAFEFPGILLNSDIEITTSHQPGAYRATTTTFSDAEYIMTEAPVDVKAQLRNNGSLPQTGVELKVSIYRENPAGGFYNEAELEEVITASIPTSEIREVSFNLADDLGKEFYPKAYGDWNTYYYNRPAYVDSLYTVPGWFSTMVNNVTPIYRIVISAQADEDVSNNIYSKDVRFYLKRSQLNILVSAENSCYDMHAGSGDDILAGHRNTDSLRAYLADLGWVNSWTMKESDTSLIQYYDVFERTAWEPKAVNYTMYNTLLWTDADEKRNYT